MSRFASMISWVQDHLGLKFDIDLSGMSITDEELRADLEYGQDNERGAIPPRAEPSPVAAETAPTKAADIAEPSPEAADVKALTALIARSQKTVTYAGSQAPDEGIRILENVVKQVTEANVKFDKDHPGSRLKPAGVDAVLRDAAAAIQTLKDKALLKVETDCASWTEKLNAAPLTGVDPVALSKEEQYKRAEKLMHLINEIEPKQKQAVNMMSRLKLRERDAALAGVLRLIATAKEQWELLIPKRQTAAAGPVPPAGVTPDARPIPPGFRGDAKVFNDACGVFATYIAKGERPDPDKVESVEGKALARAELEKYKKAERDMIANTDSLLDTLYAGKVSIPILKAPPFHSNWFKLKDEYKKMVALDPAAAKEFMTGWWWFRKNSVEKQMQKLVDKYGFQWKTVGSLNLESDIDISILSHGKLGERTVYDYEIVDEFNREMQIYGAEPGVSFDVNLYAEAPPPEIKPEAEKSQTEKDMDAMTEGGQDVGALMKIRRYMEWEDYQKLQEDTLAGLDEAITQASDNPEELAVLKQRREFTKKQFEEADDLFQMSNYKTLAASLGVELKDTVDKNDPAAIRKEKEDPLAMQNAIVTALALPANGSVTVPPDALTNPIKMQQFIAEQMERLEKDQKKMMAATNKLYVDAMKEVRMIEGEINKIKSTPGEEGKDKLPGLIARLKTLQADATFFANEAYHTPAAFAHIVGAGQTSKRAVENDPSLQGPENELKRKAEVKRLTEEKLKALSLTQFMQSFNEQLGDFLKDAKHYEEKSPFPGLGFIRSSKYFDRVCEAMEWIATNLESQVKKAANTPQAAQWEQWSLEFSTITVGPNSPGDVRNGLKDLVDMRGGVKSFAGMKDKDVPSKNIDAEQEAHVFAMQKIASLFPGAKTLRNLADILKQVGVKVNALLRKAESGQKMMAKNEKAYFGG